MKKLFSRVLALSLTVMMLLTSCALAETLRFRDKSDEVAKLQAALAELDYYDGEIDGQFGKATLKAVKAFQKAESLVVDGLAGTKTQGRLTELTGVAFGGTTETPEDPKETPENPEETPDTPETEEPEEEPTGLFAEDYRTMQIPTAGGRVRILQRALMALGFDVEVDGDYGPKTRKAVMAFQTVVGLSSDGKAGKKTLQKLEGYFDTEGNCTSGPIAGNDPAEPEVDPDAPTYGTPERTLRYGDKGLDVKYIMQRLYDLEYYNKKVDEIFGAGMLKAVKAFQKKNGLTADGKVGPATLAALFSDSVLDADDAIPAPEEEIPEGRTMKKGDKGDDVKAAQIRLSILGYYSGKLDGIFGNGTLAAVRSFQARNALTVDGKIGPRTLEKLQSANAVTANGGTLIVPSPSAGDIAE